MLVARHGDITTERRSTVSEPETASTAVEETAISATDSDLTTRAVGGE